MKIRCWGSRGSIAVSGCDFIQYGGDTTCIAAEAALAVIDWVRDSFDWPHLTNIIEPANARSIALGLRLGGVIDPKLPGIDPGDVVIRHDLRGAA